MESDRSLLQKNTSISRYYSIPNQHRSHDVFNHASGETESQSREAGTPGRRPSQSQLPRRHLRRAQSIQSNLAQGQTNQPNKTRYSFKSYARLATICIHLCKLSLQRVQGAREEFLSVFQVLDDLWSAIDKRGPYFDPADYRADTQEHLAQEAKRILQMEPKARTEKEIRYLLIVLRNIPAFAEYPLRMQWKLCQVGWYENYEPRRAIIREGHPPHSFYFILSGSVLVTAFEAGSTRTLVKLERGMSFGELAVITGSKRQATVSTKSHVELLCISALDFEDIFMAGGLKTILDPDHKSLLRTVGFLKHWPLQTVLCNPQGCVSHYFNRGQVLVRDSNNSDWIYIVKSGSLSVLKKLRYTTAQAAEAGRGGKHGMPHEARSQRVLRHASREKYVLEERSRAEVFRNHMEAEKHMEQSLPGLHNRKERLGTIDYDRVIKEYRSRVLLKPSESLKLPKLSLATRGLTAPEREPPDGAAHDLPQLSEATSPAVRTEDSGSGSWEEEKEEEQEENRLICRTSKGVYLAPCPARLRRDKPRLASRTGLAAAENTTSVSQVADTEVGGQERESVMADVDRLNIDYQRRFLERVGRKTIAETLDYKGSRDFKYTEIDLNPMFIVVQVLERGQYFGLSQVVYPDQPSVCLVSNGAECIVFSKRLFLEHASDACIRQARQSECPYPSEETLQGRLQDYANWEAHRARVYHRLVTDIRQRQARRKQYVPHIPGQYCFRSGTL